MRAAVYLRVSTSEQAREGYSLAAQESASRAYAAARSWQVVRAYSDPGVSGKSVEGRTGLAELMRDVEAGQLDAVIFWKLDRLARNLRDLLAIYDRIEAAGAVLVSVQESIDTSTPTGRLMRSVFGSIGEFERENTVERIKAGLEQKQREGELVGPVPLGYARGEDGAITLDPIIAPLLRQLFERYVGGQHSLRELAAWAQSIGMRSTEGNLLDRLSVRKLLRNTTYTGMIALRDGTLVPGKHPAIVDADLFRQVQEVLSRRRRNTVAVQPFGRTPYGLSGTARCGYCASAIVGTSTGARRYYRCSRTNRIGRAACEQPMTTVETLDGQMAAYLGGMRLPPEYLGEVVAELRRRQRQLTDETERPRLEREVERWRRLFVLGDVDEVRYKQEAAPLRRRLAELERPQEVLDVERAVRYLMEVGTLWGTSPQTLQRKFVREVFSSITIEGRELRSLTPSPLYAPLFVLDRRERFGGAVCSLAPGAGAQVAPLQSPFTGELVAVPALLVPEGSTSRLSGLGNQ